jgi:tetratricopeptide (TPR) repeat protein
MVDTAAPTANSLPDDGHGASPSPSEIRLALHYVLKSDVFVCSGRLQDFIEYVVQQYLADASRKVPAKAIAQDLYGVTLGSGEESVNVVRVDAGRLRRRLAEYYLGSGCDDPVIIHIDTGGYTPRFEVRERPVVAAVVADNPKRPMIQNSLMTFPAFGVLLLTLGFGVAVGYLAAPKPVITDSDTALLAASTGARMQIERKAMMAKSPSSIQAVTIVKQAQSLMFPVSERGQLKLTVGLFREAIQRDDDYFGGYAGAALSLSMLAIFSPEGPRRKDFLSEARLLADRAVDLAPSDAWTQSALAWTYFAEGQTDLALKHIEIALQLAPNDGNILDYYAFMMLSVGNFDATLEAADPDRERTGGAGRFSSYGFFGAANFHLGRYKEAISAILAGTFAGEAISGPTLAYLAAASHALGLDQEAQRYATDLQKNWPAFHANVVLGRLYVDPNQAMAIHKHLLAAGWTENTDLKTDGGNTD